MKPPSLARLLPLLIVAPGCFATGVYRTARTVPKGEGDFSMGFNVVRLTVENPLKDASARSSTGGDTLTFTYPNLIPELGYHYGAADNVEVGGRVVLTAGLIEGDVKYRLVGSDSATTHLAVAPAIGYHALGLAEGVQGTLPVIFTHDLNADVSLNLGVFGSFSHYAATNKSSSSSSTSTSSSSSDPDFSGNTLVGGGSVGIQFRTKGSFHFMPTVELQRALSHRGDLDELPKYTAILFAVTMGWGPNRQLNRMENTLDRLEQKVDRLQPPAPPAAP